MDRHVVCGFSRLRQRRRRRRILLSGHGAVIIFDAGQVALRESNGVLVTTTVVTIIVVVCRCDVAALFSWPSTMVFIEPASLTFALSEVGGGA